MAAAVEAPPGSWLGELGFVDVRREYLAQMSFPTEIVTARKETT